MNPLSLGKTAAFLWKTDPFAAFTLSHGLALARFSTPPKTQPHNRVQVLNINH